MTHNIRIGLCMDNFSSDFVSRKASLEDLLKMSVKFGYQGFEFTPAQMISSYPVITDEDIDHMKEILSKYHIEPFCWNIYLDTGAITGRELTENEIHKTVMQNVIYAKKIGFPLIKTTSAITTKIFHKIITLCRDMDMKLAIEIESNDDGMSYFKEFIEIIQAEGEGYAGAMIDLELLSMPAADSKSLLDITFGIYMKPEQIIKNEEILRKTSETGYHGYFLSRSQKYSLNAQTLAEQFIKSCSSMLKNNNYKIEK